MPKTIRLAFLIVAATYLDTSATAAADRTNKMQWFRHDKFGIFIHFGPYSALAGEWNGKQVPLHSEAEWIMQRFNIPVNDYRDRAHEFNPVNFDADAIAKLAKSAGMKYLVITAKHHDGFAMYHSRVSPYNIVDWTRFKRDPVKELSIACAREGIRFCVYYSHREDWDDPDGFGNTWDYNPSQKHFEHYLEYKSKPQLRELLTNYGALGLVWFDRGMDTPEHAAQFAEIVHSLQPLCLINGRIGSYRQELMGDYQDMTDNGIPSGGLEEDWETPQTLNTTWGYSKFDQDWKTPGVVIRRLVEIVSKGGNYLLNVGPKTDGSLPSPSVATLSKVGEWMQRNSDSIYGTAACPLSEYPWGRTTCKGDRIYLHVFSWPADSTIRLSGLNNQIRSGYMLVDPSRQLSVHTLNGVTLIAVPAKPIDESDTVLVLNLDGLPKVDPPLLTQDTDEGFTLDYSNAITGGQAQKRFNRDGGFHIAGWTGPGDSISWHLLVSRAGTYQATIRYAAQTAWRNGKYTVTSEESSLNNKVLSTGDWYHYATFTLGTLKFSKAGRYIIRIQPAARSNHNLMYFGSMQLNEMKGP